MVDLTERECTMILDALVAWENEGCYNSVIKDLAEEDFHRLFEKLHADDSIYLGMSIKAPASCGGGSAAAPTTPKAQDRR